MNSKIFFLVTDNWLADNSCFCRSAAARKSPASRVSIAARCR